MLLLGVAADDGDVTDFAPQGDMQSFDICKVRAHPNLEVWSDAVRRAASSSDHYRVSTLVRNGSLEVHVHPWVRVVNEMPSQVAVRSLDEKSKNPSAECDNDLVLGDGGSVDLWPSGQSHEVLFQMKPSDSDCWSMPLRVSASTIGYRGFIQHKASNTVPDITQVTVSKDELSGFLRLTLSDCQQPPYVIRNQSSHTCDVAPKGASGWHIPLEPNSGQFPFFSHLWGGETKVAFSSSTTKKGKVSTNIDLSVAQVKEFGHLCIEIGGEDSHKVTIRDRKKTSKDSEIHDACEPST
jgi:hypothetical protein